jgi:hypothetical protein
MEVNDSVSDHRAAASRGYRPHPVGSADDKQSSDTERERRRFLLDSSPSRFKPGRLMPDHYG